MKISYTSLGCKVNLYETMAIIDKFIDNGFELVEFGCESDVCLINTCTVTQTSDSKSKKAIRQAVKYSPNGIICVMGCFSQLNSKEASEIPGVDIVTGTSNRTMIYNLVIERLMIKNLNSNTNEFETINICENYKSLNRFEELELTHYENKARGFVKIQDGCENFCSYCTIPYSRGLFRSRNKDSIIKEIKNLTNLGMKEIILTGINTGAYGKDLSNYNLSHLLVDIIKEVPSVGRLRISSIEITEITDELIETISKYQNYFCNHFHIPLQGGSDEILKKMNRKYNTDYYYNRIEYLRSKIPDVNITADILCGFNGETDELFIKAKDFINKMHYGEIHVFPYSPRVKTIAYQESKKINFVDRVDGVTLKRRVKELLELNEHNALDYRLKFVGKTEDVIIEIIKDGIAFGHTSNYMEVQFENKNNNVNDLVHVSIIKAGYPVSFGKIIDSNFE